jgi:hypothetical protein
LRTISWLSPFTISISTQNKPFGRYLFYKGSDLFDKLQKFDAFGATGNG